MPNATGSVIAVTDGQLGAEMHSAQPTNVVGRVVGMNAWTDGGWPATTVNGPRAAVKLIFCVELAGQVNPGAGYHVDLWRRQRERESSSMRASAL